MKRMQLMLVHGGEGTKVTGQDKDIHIDMHGKKVVVIEEPATTQKSSSKKSSSDKPGKSALRYTQFGHSLRPEEQNRRSNKKNQAKQRRVQIQESQLMEEMDNRVDHMPRSASEPGGVCVQDSLQNTAHRTAGLKIDYQKSAHLMEAVDVEVTKAMEKGLLANNQLAMLATQSVVALEDMYALDINNDEWIRFDTRWPIPQRPYLIVAPVSREALGMGSGDDINPDRIIANRIGDWGDSKTPFARGGGGGPQASGAGGGQPDPRVQCILLFGGHNADSEAYSNSVHLATVENIATSYINLNQLLQEEKADKERQRKEAGADSSDDDTATDATDAASAAKKNKGASELQKEAIRTDSVKAGVTTVSPPER